MEGMKSEEETGMEARGGLGGRAGRTEGTLALMRFSISSMSDWEVEWRGIVSLCDIFRENSRIWENQLSVGGLEGRKETEFIGDFKNLGMI